jgi:RNA polymerase sigma-70 factor (ECF subfamily)
MKALCIKVRGESKSRTVDRKKNKVTSEIIKLVDKAAGGNFEAFGKLYGIYLDPIYRYIFYQVRDRMTAEDITEEVFVKAWKAIKSCKGKGSTFSAWLYRIAHNHLMNTLRNTNKYVSMDVSGMTEVCDPEQDLESILDEEELSDLLANLPDSQRQVVVLKFVEGMDNREIGKIMRKSEGAVRILQMRALTKLRQIIGGGVN